MHGEPSKSNCSNHSSQPASCTTAAQFSFDPIQEPHAFRKTRSCAYCVYLSLATLRSGHEVQSSRRGQAWSQQEALSSYHFYLHLSTCSLLCRVCQRPVFLSEGCKLLNHYFQEPCRVLPTMFQLRLRRNVKCLEVSQASCKLQQ